MFKKIRESLDKIEEKKESNQIRERDKEEFERKLLNQKEEYEKENQILRSEIIEFKNSFNKNVKITANQQLLLLHYSGFLDALKFQVKDRKYDLFFNVIGKNRQSVKDFFTYREQDERQKERYEEIFSEVNLNFVLRLFEEANLSEQVDRVNSDMIKLKY